MVIAHRSTLSFLLAPALAFAPALAMGQASAASSPSVIALRGGTIHTAAGPVITNGVVIIRDGKIADVGSAVAIPSGARVVDLSGKEIIPGMIDNHSHIGAAPEDLNEQAVSFGPQHRMVDALNPDDRGWKPAADAGVTTVVTGTGSGEVSSGEAAVVKTYGTDFQKRILKEVGGLKIAMGRKGPNRPPSTSPAVTAGFRPAFLPPPGDTTPRNPREGGRQDGE